ncbi:aminotransferase class I/II-fold pyridoxal phosphate-dependent enzyme [bacterium]|nr:aminotransferase class I/II-fold pyridoxal phosphate-dependent enzyme [bacterium]
MLKLKDYLVNHFESVRFAMDVMNKSGAGVCFIVKDNKLCGIATDGDLRRYILKNLSIDSSIAKAMNSKCFALLNTTSDQQIRQSFSEKIKCIPIVDENNIVVDIADATRSHRIPVLEPSLKGNELEYVVDCISSNWISSKGKYVSLFESNFESLHSETFAISTSSGTTALHLSLLALGIGSGDEVIVPNLTFAATASSVVHANATPVFCEIDPNTWCICPKSIEELITPKTKAIIPVHLYGQPADMKSITQIALKYNLYVIEDCAEALGSSINEIPVGCFGDASTFSFFGNKTISTGEGGMVLFKSKEHYNLARTLRDHGMSTNRRYWHTHIGYNYRMTNIQAALGVAQLEKIDTIINSKRRIFYAYMNYLHDCKFIDFFPVEQHNAFNSNWLFTIILNSKLCRDELVTSLSRFGIESRPVFYSLDQMPPFENYAKSASLKNSHYLSDHGISLPSSVNLADNDIEYIANVFVKCVETL